VNLETAITRAKQFYDKETRNTANINIAAKHWGFVDGSSSGQQMVAALMSFGLMQDEGTGEKRAVKLTQAALRILLDTRPDSTERAELIKQAALSPKIHKQLWDKWGTGLPSDAQLKHTLLFDWETPFNENAVDFFIGEYRSTIAFAKLAESDKVMETEVKEGDENAPAGSQQLPVVESSLRVQQSLSKIYMLEYVVPLSDGSKAVFQWPSSLSAEDVEDLKDSLKIVERKITRSSETPKTAEPD
jgi:hypothetical protein